MNAVVKQELIPQAQEGATLLSVISRAAADPQTAVEKMERLMAMYERIEAKRAESAFNDAMSDAQSRVRRVGVDADNSQTRSKYATYSKLDGAIRPIYTDSGFSLSFDTGADAPPDYVRVLCYVAHKAGHMRTYHIDMPADGKGAKGGDVMTKTHAAGSATSYGMRYLLKMIFNVAVGEDDDDGNSAAGNVLPEAATRLLDKIDLCEGQAELAKIKDEIKAAELAPKVTSTLIASYNAKLRKLKAGE